jgi:hypothetical protein
MALPPESPLLGCNLHDSRLQRTNSSELLHLQQDPLVQDHRFWISYGLS